MMVFWMWLKTGLVLGTNAYNVNSVSTSDMNSYSLTAVGGSAMAFNTDGSKMYVLGSSAGLVEYNLSTHYDFATRDTGSHFSTSLGGSSYGLAFNENGTKMYISTYTTAKIAEYTLTTGFDTSTANGTPIFHSVSTEMSGPSGMIFSPDGRKMFVADNGANDITEYNLPSPYDVSTRVVVTTTLSVAGQEGVATGIAFNGDGSQIFVTGNSATVYIYDLAVAYSISSGHKLCG